MIAQALNYMPQATALEQTAQKADAQKQTTAHNALPAAE
jgi:hypothetical protein